MISLTPAAAGLIAGIATFIGICIGRWMERGSR